MKPTKDSRDPNDAVMNLKILIPKIPVMIPRPINKKAIIHGFLDIKLTKPIAE